jgi:hypothetical protein
MDMIPSANIPMLEIILYHISRKSQWADIDCVNGQFMGGWRLPWGDLDPSVEVLKTGLKQ